jgi:hypothetical protein
LAHCGDALLETPHSSKTAKVAVQTNGHFFVPRVVQEESLAYERSKATDFFNSESILKERNCDALE